MKRYFLSASADTDLQQIFSYSVDHWGVARAERYMDDLHQALETLAMFPGIGRNAEHTRRGYRRFVHERHIVFYRETSDGIVIVRVLHHRQQPERPIPEAH